MEKSTEQKPSFKYKLDKHFRVSARGGSIKGEFVGGLVNFLVMSYIMVVLPSILCGTTGTELWKAIFLATILTVILSCLSVAFFANLPIVYAPGIGIASYMANLISAGVYTYSQTLAIVFISGAIFLFLTIIGLRDKIIAGIPESVKLAMPVGIGLFIASIGLNSNNSGIIDFLTHGSAFVPEGSSFSVGIIALVSIFTLLLMIILHCKKIKGSIFYAILAGTILDIIVKIISGYNVFAPLTENSWLPPFGEFFSNSFFNMDFVGVFTGSGGFSAVFSAIILILSFVLMDIFDTVGTIYSVCKKSKLLDKNGNIQNLKQIMYVDSACAIGGACLGVPTCTAYAESNAGIESGARTGLSSVFTSLFFLGTIFLSPLVMLIPTSATSAALIFVGILMFNGVLDIDLKNIEVAVPAFFTILLMPFTGNIAFGIAGGLITYSIIMLFTKKGKQVSPFTYLCSLLFIIYFITNGIF